DLDTETLELLEERLVAFEGTVLVVSHDREFLNNVVTSSIVFEDGNVREYVGGYDDWQRQRTQRLAATASRDKGKSTEKASGSNADAPSAKPAAPTAKRKLTYKEQQELARLPDDIERLEADIAGLHQAMADPSFYKQPGELVAQEQRRLKELESQLSTAYTRWEELESV
ncbi:MAG: ABC transporter ATP-binding protein, partial [Planctomycetales bacterium]|nr:ABC transporter ATP-binding protein [Planctomycetales bacterium]